MIKNNVAAIKCIEYILETEHDDFIYNPSDNHIYFYALCARFDGKVAHDELSSAMDSMFNKQELEE